MFFWSIVWNCLPWLREGASPPSRCNISFICFLIFHVNTIIIFHKQKWSTCTIKFLNIFLVLNNETNCKNQETLEII
jgi:hypothetical protein